MIFYTFWFLANRAILVSSDFFYAYEFRANACWLLWPFHNREPYPGRLRILRRPAGCHIHMQIAIEWQRSQIFDRRCNKGSWFRSGMKTRYGYGCCRAQFMKFTWITSRAWSQLGTWVNNKRDISYMTEVFGKEIKKELYALNF